MVLYVHRSYIRLIRDEMAGYELSWFKTEATQQVPLQLFG